MGSSPRFSFGAITPSVSGTMLKRRKKMMMLKMQTTTIKKVMARFEKTMRVRRIPQTKIRKMGEILSELLASHGKRL